MSDWLKLHRKSLESRVFSDPKLWRLWCWCLLKSNWKRGWYFGCEVQPGQFAIGREAASEELGVSGSSWYRSMQKLQEMGCIKLKANNRFTVVSIVNWAKYQAEVNNKRTTDEQPVDNKRTASEQPMDTIEEGKEGKERKEGGEELALVTLWNSKMLQKCQLTDKRYKTLKVRLRDSKWRANFEAAIEIASKSDFCRGMNDRSWTADLEWFIKPDSVTKLIEGKYDNRDGNVTITQPRVATAETFAVTGGDYDPNYNYG